MSDKEAAKQAIEAWRTGEKLLPPKGAKEPVPKWMWCGGTVAVGSVGVGIYGLVVQSSSVMWLCAGLMGLAGAILWGFWLKDLKASDFIAWG